MGFPMMFKIIAIITLGLLVEEAEARVGYKKCTCYYGRQLADVWRPYPEGYSSCRKCKGTGRIQVSASFSSTIPPAEERANDRYNSSRRNSSRRNSSRRNSSHRNSSRLDYSYRQTGPNNPYMNY